MRRTTLYTLNEQSVMAGDFVEFYKIHAPREDLHRVTDSQEMLMTICDRKILPVELVHRIIDGDQHGFYIAFEPKLREILNAPFVARLREANIRAEREHYSAIDLKNRIEDFKSSTWIVRIWKALKRDI